VFNTTCVRIWARVSLLFPNGSKAKNQNTFYSSNVKWISNTLLMLVMCRNWKPVNRPHTQHTAYVRCGNAWTPTDDDCRDTHLTVSFWTRGCSFPREFSHSKRPHFTTLRCTCAGDETLSQVFTFAFYCCCFSLKRIFSLHNLKTVTVIRWRPNP